MTYCVTISQVIGFYTSLTSEWYQQLYKQYGDPEGDPAHDEVDITPSLGVMPAPGGIIIYLRSESGVSVTSNSHGDRGDMMCNDGCVFLSDAEPPEAEGVLQAIIVELLLAGGDDLVALIDPDDTAPHGADEPRTAYGGEYGVVVAG